jgi:Cu-Zn family superoxide dismutase
MQCHNAVLALALTLLLVGCAGESAVQPGTAAVEVTLLGVEGQEVGRVALTPEDGKVRIQASLEALQPGFHGFHVHDVGVCDPDAPDGPFTTAGGHYVGGGGDHGEHAGDLPSPYAADDGIAELTTVTEAFTLDELRDGDGSALVIHAGRDNFANIPDRYTSSESGQPGPDQMTLAAGDSGSRFACGVIDGTEG